MEKKKLSEVFNRVPSHNRTGRIEDIQRAVKEKINYQTDVVKPMLLKPPKPRVVCEPLPMLTVTSSRFPCRTPRALKTSIAAARAEDKGASAASAGGGRTSFYQGKKKSLAWARTDRLQLPQVRKLPARLANRLLTKKVVVKRTQMGKARLAGRREEGERKTRSPRWFRERAGL